MPRLLAALCLMAFVAACGVGGEEATDVNGEARSCAGAEGIIVSGAWLRAAPAGRPMSAAYLTLCNAGDSPDRLLRVSTDAAGAAEIHQTRKDAAGVASMAPVASVELAPGELVAMAPGGAHIMLIGMTQAVEAGEVITLTLEFEHAPTQSILVEARDAVSSSADR